MPNVHTIYNSDSAAGGGSGGAPDDAQYLVLATDGDLSAERVLTPGQNLSGTVTSSTVWTIDMDATISVDVIDHLASADTDTNLTFGADSIRFNVGGVQHLTLTETTQDVVQVGGTTTDVDFQVLDTSTAVAFKVDAGTGDTIVTNDLYTDVWTAHVSTLVGFTGGTGGIFYKRIGNFVIIVFNISGTSDATNFTMSLPYTSANTTGTEMVAGAVVTDNGTVKTAPGMFKLPVNSAIVEVFVDFDELAWTASGIKAARGQFWYEAA